MNISNYAPQYPLWMKMAFELDKQFNSPTDFPPTLEQFGQRLATDFLLARREQFRARQMAEAWKEFSSFVSGLDLSISSSDAIKSVEDQLVVAEKTARLKMKPEEAEELRQKLSEYRSLVRDYQNKIDDIDNLIRGLEDE